MDRAAWLWSAKWSSSSNNVSCCSQGWPSTRRHPRLKRDLDRSCSVMHTKVPSYTAMHCKSTLVMHCKSTLLHSSQQRSTAGDCPCGLFLSVVPQLFYHVRAYLRMCSGSVCVCVCVCVCRTMHMMPTSAIIICPLRIVQPQCTSDVNRGYPADSAEPATICVRQDAHNELMSY